MIMYVCSEEIMAITDKCSEIYQKKGCKECILFEAVCKKTGGLLTFRPGRKEDVQSKEQI